MTLHHHAQKSNADGLPNVASWSHLRTKVSNKRVINRSIALRLGAMAKKSHAARASHRSGSRKTTLVMTITSRTPGGGAAKLIGSAGSRRRTPRRTTTLRHGRSYCCLDFKYSTSKTSTPTREVLDTAKVSRVGAAEVRIRTKAALTLDKTLVAEVVLEGSSIESVGGRVPPPVGTGRAVSRSSVVLAR